MSNVRAGSLVLMLLVVGCSKGTPPITTSATMSTKGFAIEVKTLPGLVADLDGKTAKADGNGVAHFDLTADDLVHREATTRKIKVSGRSGLTSYLGEANVELPFSVRTLSQFPDAPKVLAIVGKEQRAGKDESHWKTSEYSQADFAEDGSLPLLALGPRLATVTVGGQAVKTDANGVGSFVLSSNDLLGFVSCTGNMFEDPVPSRALDARVSLAGAPDTPLSLPLEWVAFSGGGFRKRFGDLAARPLGGARAGTPLVVYLSANDRLSCDGRAGTLATADAVAVGTGKPPRKMTDCKGYRRVNNKHEYVGGEESAKREGIDEDVVMFDTHTGRELGRKTFEAEDVCSNFPGKALATQQTHPARTLVQSWMMDLLKAGPMSVLAARLEQSSPGKPASPKPPARPASKAKRPSAVVGDLE